MEKGPNETKGPSAVRITSTVTDNKNETRFRSVLLYEPLPINDSGNNHRGYVHLQGAFKPKRKAVVATAATTADNDDDSKTSYWKNKPPAGVSPCPYTSTFLVEILRLAAESISSLL